MAYSGQNTPIRYDDGLCIWQITSSADGDSSVNIPLPFPYNADEWVALTSLTFRDLIFWATPTNAPAGTAAVNLILGTYPNLQMRKTVTAGTATATWLVFALRPVVELVGGSPR